MLSLTLAGITSVLNTRGHTAAFVAASELYPDVGLGRAKKKNGRKPQGRCRGMTSHVNHGHANKLSYTQHLFKMTVVAHFFIHSNGEKHDGAS